MSTPHPSNSRQGDPFALDGSEFPFVDACLIQTIASPTHLQRTGTPEQVGGGFFVETESPPLEHFQPATLITGAGKRVQGFAADTLLFFPVAIRVRWETGEPGNRTRVSEYVEGARSKSTVLAVLATGHWIKLTARGLASKSLSAAFREHFLTLAKQQHKPFAAALTGIAGQAKQVKSSMVTPFQFVSLKDELCPETLGWQVRDRWDEIQAWRGPSQTAQPCLATASDSREALTYSNGLGVAQNDDERTAFLAHRAAMGTVPTDREALRVWYQENQQPAPAEA